MTRTERPAVLITGAAKRLGRALALDFGRRGWAVGIHYHGSRDEAQAVVSEVKAAGGDAFAAGCDLANATAAQELVPLMARTLGPLTCLINNASLFVYDDIGSLDVTLWDRHQAVNLRAPVLLTKAFAAQAPAGHDAVAINIIDQRVWKPTPHFFSYSASKAGLWSVTRTLAQGLAPAVRVNAIGPGPMLQSVHQSAAAFAEQTRTVPLQRGTSTDEIGTAVRFILESPAMTGQMIALDGGQHLAWATPDIGDGRG